MAGAAHLVSDDNSLLPGALNLEHVYDGPIALLDVPHDLLVDFERVGCRLFEEDGVGHGSDVGAAIRSLLNSAGEVALGHKVAAELLGGGGG